MAENSNIFKGYTVTAHCEPDYNFAHNLRIIDEVVYQEHVGEGEHENWLGGSETNPEILFNKIFEIAVKKFNDAQIRSDRKIKSYYQRVIDDGRFGKTKTLKRSNRERVIDISKKPIYEFIIQVGNREVHPDSQIIKPIFKSFIEKKWPELFGNNFRLVRVDYHDDEYSEDEKGEYTIKSPAHLHVDFVPVVVKDPETLKGKGTFKLELQHSLSQACEQAGYNTDHLSEEERKKKNELKAKIKEAKEQGNKELQKTLQEQLVDYTTYTNQQRFEEAVRFSFANHCRENGLEIDLTPGKKHSHVSKEFYKIQKEREKLTASINKLQEKEKEIDKKENELDEKGNKIDAQAKNITRENIILENAFKAAESTMQAGGYNEKTNPNILVNTIKSVIKYARTQFERVKKVLEAPLEKIEEWCKAAREAGKKTLGEFLFPKIENQKEVQKDIKKESKKPSTEKDRSDDYGPGL
ncbi:MAG: hypothetical protein IKX70_02455 [Treponema sp.]|nr:hypothetical protein [Treponema sp.]